METIIELSKKTKKQLQKLPKSILSSFASWVLNVEMIGIEETRKIPGYHDELLKSPREGQRSVRLNRAYRVFYTVHENSIRIVHIIEINKHKYRV